MAIKKITYDNKLGVIPKNIHINEVWDDDMNEIKDAINTNADQVIQNTNDIENIISGSLVPDATALVKGKLKLAGDLSGTADLPTVPGLLLKADDSNVVHKTLTEDITGNKTFLGTIIVQTPIAPDHAVTKEYADGLVVGLLDDRGSYNASTNVFPSTGGSGTSGAILKGDLWYVSVAGTLGGKAVNIGDSFRALVDSPAQVTGNWSVLSSNLGYVPANDANVVHKTGNEFIAGTKTVINSLATPSKFVFVTQSNATDTALFASTNSSLHNGIYVIGNGNDTIGAMFSANGVNTILVKIEPEQNNPTSGKMLVLSNKKALNGVVDISTPLTVIRDNVEVAKITDLGNINANSFVKSGGLGTQFLKADGSIDSNSYALTSSLHNPVTIGTANGLSLATQVLSLALANTSTTGALSSTDWNTFNNKQPLLTNPVTGTGTAGQVSFWNGTNVQSGDTGLVYDSTSNILTTLNGGNYRVNKFINGTQANPNYEPIATYGFGTAFDAGIYGGNSLSTNNGTFLKFVVNSTTALNTPIDAMILSSNGNVVLPVSDARIFGGDGTGRLVISNNSTTSYIGLNGTTHTTPNEIQLVTTTGNIRAFTSSVERFTILNNGNTGIGVAVPIGKLDIAVGNTNTFSPTTQVDGTISFGNSSSGSFAPHIAGKSTTSVGLYFHGFTSDTNPQADMQFSVRKTDGTDFTTLTSSAFRFTRLNTSLMNVLRNGNVGIGTDAPNYNLHVNSNVVSSFMQFTSTTSGTSPTDGLVIGTSSTGEANFINRENTPITFHTNNNEKVRIHASGGVSIGNTTDLGAGTLNVTGNITASAGTVANHVVNKSQLDLKANLASPAFTGVPTAPTAAPGTNTTQVATTAFVLANTSTGSLQFDIPSQSVWNNGKGGVSGNTVFGQGGFYSNTTGQSNTIYGSSNLPLNTTGNSNVVIGTGSMSSNLTGGSNIAIGNAALINTTASLGNISIGQSSARYISTGSTNLTSSTNSIFIGGDTRASANGQTNQIVIGEGTVGNGSNTVTIGNTAIINNVFNGNIQALTYNGVKKYVAQISQTTTGAPVLTVLENTTGATITSARTSTGVYTLTFNISTLIAGKTKIVPLQAIQTNATATITRTSTSVITITTLTAGVVSDSSLGVDNSYIDISIYP